MGMAHGNNCLQKQAEGLGFQMLLNICLFSPLHLGVLLPGVTSEGKRVLAVSGVSGTSLTLQSKFGK